MWSQAQTVGNRAQTHTYRSVHTPTHAALLQSIGDMDLISLIILIIGCTGQAVPLGGDEGGARGREAKREESEEEGRQGGKGYFSS